MRLGRARRFVRQNYFNNNNVMIILSWCRLMICTICTKHIKVAAFHLSGPKVVKALEKNKKKLAKAKQYIVKLLCKQMVLITLLHGYAHLRSENVNNNLGIYNEEIVFSLWIENFGKKYFCFLHINSFFGIVF